MAKSPNGQNHIVTSFVTMIETQTEHCYTLHVPKQIGHYVLGQVIGRGATSVVFSATDRQTGKEYAMKVMSRFDLDGQGLLQHIERELSIIQTLHHSNIIEFHELVRDSDLLFVVLEKCDGGDLFEYMLDWHTRDMDTVKRLFRDIVLAVQYLHQQGIAHNDIKPENIILDANGRAKLTDFGFAKCSEIAGDEEKLGTLVYMAPELLKRGAFNTQKADIWSLGIVLYTMMVSRFPYPCQNESQTVQYIKAGKLMYPNGIDADAKRLIRMMTKLKPEERPTIDDILTDSFFHDALLDGTEKNADNLQLSDSDVAISDRLWQIIFAL
jgi:serine/threonine protein kinase